jgi:hypothetical protein
MKMLTIEEVEQLAETKGLKLYFNEPPTWTIDREEKPFSAYIYKTVEKNGKKLLSKPVWAETRTLAANKTWEDYLGRMV